MPAFHSNSPTPEANASRSEVRSLLEEAVLALPLRIGRSSFCAMWKR